MGWNKRCVVLLSHEYALGRAFADCNAHEDKKVISKQLWKLCVPKLRRAAQGKGNCSCMTTRNCSRGAAWSGRNGQSLKFIHIRFELEPNADAAHDENKLLDKKVS